MNPARYGWTRALISLILLAPLADQARARVITDDRATVSNGQSDSQIQADINKQLGKSKFNGLAATVQGGVITLVGTTDLFEYKQEADKKGSPCQECGSRP